jgi:hypothetical protein
VHIAARHQRARSVAAIGAPHNRDSDPILDFQRCGTLPRAGRRHLRTKRTQLVEPQIEESGRNVRVRRRYARG